MKKRALFLFACTIAVVLALYAIYLFPIPGTDSMVYIPAALLYSMGQGLANPLYYVTKITDLTHTNRFNYYVPFQAHLLGILSSIKPGVRTIFIICSVFGAASLLLYTRHIGRLLAGPQSVLMRIAVFLSVSYMGMYLLPTGGRPECLTILMALAVYLLYQRRHKVPPVLYNGALCLLWGLMLSTQILSCFFCFLFFVTYDLLDAPNVWRAVWVNLLRFAALAVICCAAIAMSPNGFSNTLAGIAAHAHHVMGRTDRSVSLFIFYWVLYPYNFGFLLLFLLGAIFYLREVWARLRSSPAAKVALVLGVQLVILGGVVKFILYASPAVYNVTQFVLPISAYVLYNITLVARGWQRSAFAVTALVTYLAGSLIFARSFILFADYLHDGKTYDNARPLVKQIAARYPGVYISMGLWCLFDDPNDVRIFEPRQMKSGDIIIVEQANHPFPEVLRNNCTVLYDWSTTERRRFLGLPITQRPQGYSFIVCRAN